MTLYIPRCPVCLSEKSIVRKYGFFGRKTGDCLRIQRYRCYHCKGTFSSQTPSLTYRDRKGHIYDLITQLVCSSVSQRRIALILNLHRTTVSRKIQKLGLFLSKRNHTALQNRNIQRVMFDEMETFEHTKCKPLAIAVAVEEESQLILGLEVSSMPAKGQLAKIALKKYGFRKNKRKHGLKKLFRSNLKHFKNLLSLKSDQCPWYRSIVNKYFPLVSYTQYKGRRGCIVGQGELKEGSYDPLFWLNHTCAMIRDNIKRLTRRTWCTTKKPEYLKYILDIYTFFHNTRVQNHGRFIFALPATIL